MRGKKILMLALGLAFLGLASVAMADSITPSSFSATLGVGESVTVRKTVTITSEPPTSAKVDVFFLTDSTGSMGGLINQVKTKASDILTNTASLGDVAFGAAEYRDRFDTFGGGVQTFRINQNLTTNAALAQAGINQWAAGGGNDFPEANVYGLQQTALNGAWRADSTRILVWFGDAPGHDPAGPAGPPVVNVTEAQAIAALTGANVVVQAVNLASPIATAGLNAAASASTEGGASPAGQANRVTAATGGSVFPLSGDIEDVIADAIESVFATYSSVALGFDTVAGVGMSAVPVSYTGSFTRDVDRTFEFDVTFTGLVPGDYSFVTRALVNGGSVATESDRIRVTNGVGVPEPGILLLLSSGLLALAGLRRRMR